MKLCYLLAAFYEFSLTSFISPWRHHCCLSSVLAISFNWRRKVLPLAVLGMAFIMATPPLSLLIGPTLSVNKTKSHVVGHLLLQEERTGIYNPNYAAPSQSVQRYSGAQLAELDWVEDLSINQSNFYSANIPGEARLRDWQTIIIVWSQWTGRNPCSKHGMKINRLFFSRRVL